MHRYLLHNGEVCEASTKRLSPGQVGLLNGWGVFSTIRVHNGVLFAWERHWARMQHDAKMLHVPFPEDPDSVRLSLLKLVEANGAHFATLRVAVIRNRGGMWEGPGVDRDYDLVALTTELKHWGGGVKLGVVANARYSASPFTGAKILAWAMNLAWLEEAQGRGYDEVILLNERGEVSECTSANIFIADGNRLWTPPLSSGCLPGVTRDLLLSEVRVPGVEAGEKDLRLSDLERADEVFITSTTRDLLPVAGVEGISLRRAGSPGTEVLSKAFMEYVDSYAGRYGK